MPLSTLPRRSLLGTGLSLAMANPALTTPAPIFYLAASNPP